MLIGKVPCIMLISVLVLGLVMFPAAARGPTIKDILPGDIIFASEENLDLSGLTSDGAVQSLVRLEGGELASPVLPVGTGVLSWNVPSYLDGNDLGRYAVLNGTGIQETTVVIARPRLTIEATAASPHHDESLEGLEIPEGTRIAFRITSYDVGSAYHSGSVYPASVDIVMTMPGNIETSIIGGKVLEDITLDSPEFYTDDPGKPGASTISEMDPGTYEVQARWRNPEEFAAYAEDSNIIRISVKDDSGVDITLTPTVTATPTEPATQPTTVPPTTPPKTEVTTPVPQETTPGTPATSPTPEPTPATPLAAWIPIVATLVAVAGFILFRRK